MESILANLLTDILSQLPIILILAVTGVYIAKRFAAMYEQMANMQHEMADIKNELHKINFFFCDRVTCAERHPELGKHCSKLVNKD